MFRRQQIGSKNKQLIALAIGVHVHHEYWIVYHTKGYLDAGATEEEMMEATGVTAALGGDSTMGQGITIWQDALEDFTGTVQ
ncbi:carboxymuconolactone decarboxylase family protein [Sporosarcina sp. HYO08]|uniref:carboxymuconolactone decarboxylase family protein n=1 Tax=Sporosarcina sp. HYO08 TaxID=1759557 RepID=UPI000798521D|nr:carboxymuconolactone decarboxylase family protein [Sporosarcina sp. HYO08]KXH87003.1 hypothetical protein AU377_00010 [Sporosarcina sp. HYO08]